MKSEQILFAMNDMDDEFVQETTLSAPMELNRTHRRRGLKAAIIAAVLIIAAGTAAYASGVFTAPFSIWKSKDAEPVPSWVAEYPEDVTVLDGQIVNTDQAGKITEIIDTINIEIDVSDVKTGSVQGPLKDEAAQVVWEKFRDDLSKGSINKDDKYYGSPYYKEFDSLKEAVDYIGSENYEGAYFPFEETETSVYVIGMYRWNYSTDILTDVPDGFDLQDIWVDYRGSNGRIDISEHDEVAIHGSQGGMYGFGGIPDDGTRQIETFSTSAGYNGTKMTNVEGRTDKYGITCIIVKNDCIYRIFISCEWADKAEADQIFTDWAEHF